MQRDSIGRSWLAVAGTMLLVAVIVAAGTSPASAERQGPEKARGGLTVAEQVAQQRALHAELMARMPAGASNAPVFVDITQEDRDAIDAPVATGKAPLRIGVVKQVGELVGKRGDGDFTRGALRKNSDGSFDWAVTVNSSGAQAMRLHLTGFSLPPTAEMFVVAENGQADGPYTGRGRNGDGDFWTRSLVGETVTVMVRYNGNRPDMDRKRIGFTISDVGHIRGRPPRPVEESHDSWPCSDNASCVVDAMCGVPSQAAPAIDAIAKLEWITGQFINTCTGGLIADTDGSSQIPYMLSANHCFSSNISNLETFFNYATDSCNGGCPDSLVTGGTPPAANTVGMTINATGGGGDFTLMTLSQAPPAGATFLGWNNAPIANTNGANLYRVSNPNFGPQAYSQHDVTTSSPTCTGWPRGERIYSVDQTGATMGGSSGSPVLNSSSEVVGQLSGCCGFNCANECDAANNWTVDGALAFYWDSVSEFLDPVGGCTSDAECNDNQFCTGTETCVAGSCQSSGDPCAVGTTCNEATDTCDVNPPGCVVDGVCGVGEDCNNCPDDCRSKTNGKPSGQYCCDGDLSGCGDPRCNESGFVCGDSMCGSDPECDDGQFCNGFESCGGGFCQAGSDPCPGQGCDEGTDQCVSCGGNKATCSVDGDCCSNKCRGGTCKGN